MRIKTLILLGCCSFFWSTLARADVDFIAFRFAKDGTIRDISTSLTADTRAEITPIVEPDGSVTDPSKDPEFSEEETDALFLTDGDSDEGEETPKDEDSDDPTPPLWAVVPIEPADAANDCTAAGGTMVSYLSQSYCCKDGKVLEGGSWSSNVLMPQCGCSGDGVYTSMKKGISNGQEYTVCCRQHTMVESYATGGSGTIVEKGKSELCKCPTVVGEQKVDELTNLDFTETAGGVLYCCAGNKRLQTATYISPTDDDYCKCNATREACTEAACTALGWSWVNNTCSSASCHGDGEVLETETGNICCKDGHKYDEDNNQWESGIDLECVTCDQDFCHCPGSGALDPTYGTMCCEGTKPWNGTEYSGFDATCGCPSGYDQRFFENNPYCCNNGQFYGMDVNNAEDRATAVRVCGCATGQTRVEDANTGNIYCCTGAEAMAWHTRPDNPPTASEVKKWCGCAGGKHYSGGECVECVNSDHCAGRADNKTVCNTSTHLCVACLSNTCPAEQFCREDGCKTCAELDPGSSKTHYENGKCYECTQDSHCAGRADGKVICDLDSHTCEKCVLWNAADEDRRNTGCSDATKPYCVLDTDRICSACRNNDDCPADKKNCVYGSGCSVDYCGERGVNAQGECKCEGTTPVFDYYWQKCVTCYDSISGGWTDLGCNAVPDSTKRDTGVTSDASPYNYSPYQDPKEPKKPVCLVTIQRDANGQITGTDAGRCVECTSDDMCEGEKQCIGNVCKCKDETTFSGKKCVSCLKNNGSSGSFVCVEDKPLCQNGTCTCKDNWDSTKKTGDGKCPPKKPVCDATEGKCKCTKNYTVNDAESCPSDFPVCNNGECKTCEAVDPNHATYDSTTHACVGCSAHATYKNGKCVCAAGYGVVSGQKSCTNANIQASKTCTQLKNRGDNGRAEVFNFNTVSGITYDITFPTKVSVDDYFWITCGGSTKYFCDSNKDCGKPQSSACSNAAGTCACSSQNYTVVGNGGACKMYIQNGNNSCETHACGDRSRGGDYVPATVSVADVSKSYTP